MPHQPLPKDLQKMILGYFDLKEIEHEIKSSKYLYENSKMTLKECQLIAFCLATANYCAPQKINESCPYTFLRTVLNILCCPVDQARASSKCIKQNIDVHNKNYRDTKLARFFIDLESTAEPKRQTMHDGHKTNGYRELK